MYGIPRKWYFPLQKSYWFSKQVNQEIIQQNANLNNEIIELANEGEHSCFSFVNNYSFLYLLSIHTSTICSGDPII